MAALSSVTRCLLGNSSVPPAARTSNFRARSPKASLPVAAASRWRSCCPSSPRFLQAGRPGRRVYRAKSHGKCGVQGAVPGQAPSVGATMVRSVRPAMCSGSGKRPQPVRASRRPNQRTRNPVTRLPDTACSVPKSWCQSSDSAKGRPQVWSTIVCLSGSTDLYRRIGDDSVLRSPPSFTDRTVNVCLKSL